MVIFQGQMLLKCKFLGCIDMITKFKTTTAWDMNNVALARLPCIKYTIYLSLTFKGASTNGHKNGQLTPFSILLKIIYLSSDMWRGWPLNTWYLLKCLVSRVQKIKYMQWPVFKTNKIWPLYDNFLTLRDL